MGLFITPVTCKKKMRSSGVYSESCRDIRSSRASLTARCVMSQKNHNLAPPLNSRLGVRTSECHQARCKSPALDWRDSSAGCRMAPELLRLLPEQTGAWRRSELREGLAEQRLLTGNAARARRVLVMFQIGNPGKVRDIQPCRKNVKISVKYSDM